MSRGPTRQALATRAADVHMAAMTKGETYRKRAEELGKAMKKRHFSDLERMQPKKKALEALADIEDWLDGKPGSQMNKRI
jgi:hypothetical protein